MLSKKFVSSRLVVMTLLICFTIFSFGDFIKAEDRDSSYLQELQSEVEYYKDLHQEKKAQYDSSNCSPAESVSCAGLLGEIKGIGDKINQLEYLISDEKQRIDEEVREVDQTIEKEKREEKRMYKLIAIISGITLLIILIVLVGIALIIRNKNSKKGE